MTNDDCDIYLAIAAITSQCPHLSFQYLHVKGHQDNRPLTIAKQHNVDYNHCAKHYVQNHALNSTAFAHPEFEAAQPHLKIAGKVICCCFLPALCQVPDTLAYWDYLRKQFNWTYADATNVQWATLNSALQSLPSNDQHHMMLFIHDKLPLQTSKLHPHLGL